jgi:hypothetical protein
MLEGIRAHCVCRWQTLVSRHPDIVDELQRLRLCSRCILRMLGSNDVDYFMKPTASLDAILTAAVTASPHSRSCFSSPVPADTPVTLCPLCCGTLQYMEQAASPQVPALAVSVLATLRAADYRVPYCLLHLSTPSHVRWCKKCVQEERFTNTALVHDPFSAPLSSTFTLLLLPYVLGAYRTISCMSASMHSSATYAGCPPHAKPSGCGPLNTCMIFV